LSIFEIYLTDVLTYCIRKFKTLAEPVNALDVENRGGFQRK